MNVLTKQLIMALLVFNSCLASNAYIHIHSPKNNTVFTHPHITITGKSSNSKTLHINRTQVPLTKSGHFTYKTRLENPNQDHFYTLIATDKQDQPKETLLRLIYKPKENKKIRIHKKSSTIPPPPQVITKTSKSRIITPINHSKSHNKTIYLSGLSPNARYIKINNTTYPVHESGHFHIPYQLSTPNQLEKIVLHAIDTNNKVEKISHHIYFHAPTPNINFHTLPKYNNTRNKTLEFTGTVQHTESLWANQEKIPLDKNGKFIYTKDLRTPDKKEVITFTAIGKGGQESKIVKHYTLVNPKKSKIILKTPPETFESHKDHVTFSGKVENAREFWINHLNIPLSEDGYFEYTVKLNHPYQEKSFILKAINEFGHKDIKACSIYYIPPKPILKIISPQTRSTSTEHKVTIKGQAINAYAVDINNETISLDEFGFFEKTLLLKQPNHLYKIIISTYSDHEEEAQEQRYITYEPTSTPILLIESPEENATTTKDFIIFKGQAQQCKNLSINDRHVALDQNGYFNEQFKLPDYKQYTFTIEATGKNNKIITTKRHLTRKALPLSTRKPKKENTNIIRLATNPNLAYLNKKISLDLTDTDIRDVLKILAKKSNLNIITDKSVQGKISISLIDVKIKQALDLILNSQGFSYQLTDRNLLIGNTSNIKKASLIETRIIALNNLPALQAYQLLQKKLKIGESIEILEQQNKLIINADTNNIDDLITLITAIDQEKVPQIILEAQILEVSKQATKELGIEWIQSLGLSYSTHTKIGSIKSDTLESSINFLQEQGHAKMLAKPRIQAINKKQAEIFIGNQVPIPSQTTDQNGTITKTYEYINVGITLRIKPDINISEGEIKIDIEPEITYDSKEKEVPTIRTRRVKTTVFVKDGKMVLIGGLFNSHESNNEQQMPMLGNIPLLKNLFKNKGKYHHEDELMIAITPKIINMNSITN
ncbi:MAG: hypothetical protein VW378_07990 [bacterium]